MAKLINSLLSGSSGKIGQIVVVQLGDQEIIRALPKKRAGSSVEQLLVQHRMKMVYAFLSGYGNYARKFFGQKVGVRSCYNFAMTSILKAFKLDYENNRLDPVYSEIEFSSGSLLPPVPAQLTSAEPEWLTLTWVDNAAGNPERATDQVQLLYCVGGEKTPVFIENAARRSDAVFTLALPPGLSGKTLHVWMAFRNVAQTEVSDSAYCDSLVIN